MWRGWRVCVAFRVWFRRGKRASMERERLDPLGDGGCAAPTRRLDGRNLYRVQARWQTARGGLCRLPGAPSGAPAAMRMSVADVCDPVAYSQVTYACSG